MVVAQENYYNVSLDVMQDSIINEAILYVYPANYDCEYVVQYWVFFLTGLSIRTDAQPYSTGNCCFFINDCFKLNIFVN